MSYIPVDALAAFPIGGMILWPSVAMPIPPVGIPFKFVPCDGSLYNNSDYPEAAGILTNFGITLTQFRVPDLRGRFPIGIGTDQNINASGNGNIGVGTAGTLRNIGDFGGEATHIQTLGELASHSHIEQASSTPSGVTTGIVGDATTTGFGNTDIPTALAGSSTPMKLVPSFVAINYIIRLL